MTANPPGLVALADQVQRVVVESGEGVRAIVLIDGDGHAEIRCKSSLPLLAEALRELADQVG